MKTYLDCISCFVRQALAAARVATDDEALHEEAVRRALELVAGFSFTESPAVMGGRLHALVRELTGNNDPYEQIKGRSNRAALAVLGRLREIIRDSSDRFEAAVRVALAGNSIDYGVVGHSVDGDLMKFVEEAFEAPLDEEALERFRRETRSAERVFYVLDNSGEIVFDRLLIEQIGPEKVVAAVRGRPIINDATMKDVVDTGLASLVTVVDSGMDIPGTVLEDCTEDFKHHYARSDVVVAKGQGNFETLEDDSKVIFYLLRVKCPVLARDLEKPVGSIVVAPNSRAG